MKRTLEIRFTDLVRATLPDDCGNEGYVGVSPDGSKYHVVVPVDRQIARGLKFYDPPKDGTPFGGYKGWLYLRCLTYSSDPLDEKVDMERCLDQARENGRRIRAWAAKLGIGIEIKEEAPPVSE